MRGHLKPVTAALLLSSTTASAEPHRHDGFYWGAGPNLGFANATRELSVHSIANTSESTSLTAGFDLRVGGFPGPGIVVGGAAIAAVTPGPRVVVTCDSGCPEQSSEYTGETSVMLGVGPALQVYPWPEKGPSFGIDLGYGRAHGVTGLFVVASAGFGFWIDDEWSLGPTASLLYFGGSAGGEGVSVRYLYPSLGVTAAYH